MYCAQFEKITLKFKRPGGTSRGILKEKNSWILTLWLEDNPQVKGYGEASIIENLSPDWPLDYEVKIEEVAQNINQYIGDLTLLDAYPSIQLAIETALNDLKSNKPYQIFKPESSDSKNSIPINGLIWMGDESFMIEQIEEKIAQKFNCIKLKIGAIDFETELKILQHIRKRFDRDQIELRVDANGAFKPQEALHKLRQLSEFDIHSIEQPIQPKQPQAMAELCKVTPVPIALDEELIGITGYETKVSLLKTICPQYIILKPSLIGGFKGTDEWIAIADSLNIRWWITSALEANIGLNAIAQYTLTKNNPLHQGLGTGSLFTNNIEPFLTIKDGHLIL